MWVWGYNAHGQHGTGKATTFEAPEKVSTLGLAKAVAVGAGVHHSLALRENGTVAAWGYNGHGQLGNGTVVNSATPVNVSIPTSVGLVKAIAAGGYHNLALLQDGSVWAWGLNDSSALGNANATIRGPVKVSGLNKPVIAIAAGASTRYSLALLNDGTVWAWGANNVAQLGNGTTANSATPVRVSGLTGVKAIAAGDDYGMALKEDGTVWVWGGNNAGQLGNGSTAIITTPVQAVGLSGIRAIAAGFGHSLAVS